MIQKISLKVMSITLTMLNPAYLLGSEGSGSGVCVMKKQLITFWVAIVMMVGMAVVFPPYLGLLVSQSRASMTTTTLPCVTAAHSSGVANQL